MQLLQLVLSILTVKVNAHYSSYEEIADIFTEVYRYVDCWFTCLLLGVESSKDMHVATASKDKTIRLWKVNLFSYP